MKSLLVKANTKAAEAMAEISSGLVEQISGGVIDCGCGGKKVTKTVDADGTITWSVDPADTTTVN